MDRASRVARVLALTLALLAACSPKKDDEPARTLSRLEVTPAAPTVPAGAAAAFHATAVYSDQTTADVTAEATWTSSAPTILDVSNAAGSKGEAQALAAGPATITATFEGVSGSASATVVVLTLVEVRVTPAAPSLPKGSDLQLTATAVYDDDSTYDVTATATWSSLAPATASVSDAAGSKGRVHAEAEGETSVSATFGGQSGSVTVTVTPAALASVRVEPLDPEIPVGGAVALHAYAVYSDASEVEVTGAAAWTASPSGVVSLGAPGSVTGAAPGTATVTATYEGKPGSASVTVRPAVLESLRISPAAPATVVGGTVQLAAAGTYDNGQVVDVTSLVTWSSDAPLVASVSNEAATRGLLTGLSVGPATVTAALGAVSTSVIAQVTALQVAAVRVDPDVVTVSPSRSVALRAFGVDASGAEVELTGAATWTTSASGVATVSGSVVTGAAVGSAVVTATYGMRSGTADVKVETPHPVSLAIRTGGRETAGVGMLGAVQAKAVYSDRSERDVTELAAWTSSAPGVVSVSDVPGSKGDVRCASAGTADVVATFAGLSATVTFTVTPRAVRWVTVSVAPGPMPVGVTHAFRARAVYDDWTSEDVTALATWSASGAVSVDASGVATTLVAGGGVVTATYGGVSGSTLLSVTGSAPTTLTLALSRATIGVGDWTWWDAVLVYAGGERLAVTAGATLISRDPAIADVIQVWDGTAVPHGLSAGTATIEARYGDLVGSASLTVTAPSPLYLTPLPDLPVGQTVRASVSSGSAELNDEATWTSSNPDVATVTSGAGAYRNGYVTATGPGSATITVTYGALTTTRTVTVRARALTVDVTPATAEIVEYDAMGTMDEQQFVATARLADGGTLDVTRLADWSTSDYQIAGTTYGMPGHVAGANPGTTIVTASLAGVAGHAILTVRPEPLTSLYLEPRGPYRLPAGVTRRLYAYGSTWSGGYVSAPPRDVTWTSSDTAVAAFSTEPGHEGELTTVGNGTATLSATYGGVTRTETVYVAELVSLAPVTTPLSVKIGQAKMFGVRATYACTPLPCMQPTFDVAPFMDAWTSSDPTVVTAAGATALGLRAGAVTLSATFGGQPVSLPVTVAAPVVQSVAVTAQPDYGYFVGAPVPVSARALLDNGQWVDVTDVATWSVSSHTVGITIGQVTGTPPALEPLAAGTGSLLAAYGGTSGTTYVSVSSTAPAALVFNPSVLSLPVGGAAGARVQVPTTSYSSDHAGTEAVVTSSNPAIVEVENGADAVVVRAKGVGAALLTASYRGVEVYAVVSVHAEAGPMDVSLGYFSAGRIHVHERASMYALAGGARGDPEWYGVSVTDGATWTSSDPGIARVVAPGVVEGVASGTAVVTATLGAWSASERVTVVPGTLEQLALSTFAVAVPAGTSYDLEAGGYYSDGGSALLQHAVTWWTDDAAIADFDPATPGLLRGNAPGLTYVEARFDGKSARIPVTVF